MKKLIFFLFLLPVIVQAQKIITTKTVTTIKDVKGNVLKIDSSFVTYTVLPDTVNVPVPVIVVKDTTIYKDTCLTPTPVNQPPVANAGADKEVILPNGVSLTGAGSDPEGQPISFKWIRIATGEIVGTTATINLSFSVAGNYFYMLTVTDNKGLSASDDVKVTVKDAPPVTSTTIPLTFTQITSDYSRPGAGAEQWYNTWAANIPNVSMMDRYWRFNWAGINPSDGTYSWTFFDSKIKECIDKNQKFSFGIMTYFEYGAGSDQIASFEGAASAYPQWVHAKMQSEAAKDWKFNNDWIPNWNSPSYLSALEKFYKALNDHLYNTTYKNVKFSDVINYIDIRGYGNFGEWHTYQFRDSEPQANRVTTATLIKIIDIHKNSFPNFRLQALISGFDNLAGGWSNMQPEVAYKLLTDKNNAGEFGWRRDNWGNTASWYPAMLENNTMVYNGIKIKDLIMNKWKTAPITGEPYYQYDYADLANQMVKYHAVSFGNGNQGTVIPAQIAAASKAAGYRITLTGGSVTTAAGSLGITLNWSNTGVTPTYENWIVTYELRQGATVVKSLTSSFTPTMFLPGTKNVTDNFTGLPTGSYDLYLVVKNNYRTLPLSVNGRNADGSYTLKSNIQL